jgi:Ser/Thr protein kinase RdoA (MazF antagonist)
MEKHRNYLEQSRQNYRYYYEAGSAKEGTPLDRIDYRGDIKLVIDRLANAYGIGKVKDFYVIEVGYEDCNIALQTEKGKYVAKIFSKQRDQENIARYNTMMEKAVEAGVNHPILYKLADGTSIFRDREANNISMVLMKFIEGFTLLEMDRIPNKDEVAPVFKQVAMIHRMNFHPPYVVDSWAIVNVAAMYERVRAYIELVDIKLIEKAIDRYNQIPVDRLPHCFVHGDFSKANAIKGDDGKIYILDFSVANWYPRIQEIAVIAANLFQDKNHSSTLRERCAFVADAYDKINPLTAEEKQYLYDYARGGSAMELMGPLQEKYLHGNKMPETEYRIEVGRSGLRDAFATD